MALFDTRGGLGGLLGDLGDYGIGLPSQTGGLIDDPAQRDAINKRALFSGGLNALLTYAATPKNLNTGSAIPYLSKAGLAGFNASQDVIDRALNSAYKSQLLKGRNDPFGQIDISKFTPESIKAFQEKRKGTADVPGVDDFSILKEKVDAPKAGYKLLSKDESKSLIAQGFPLNPNAVYQISPAGQYELVPGTTPKEETKKNTTRILTSNEVTLSGLDTSRGQKYTIDTSGDIKLIPGQIKTEDKTKAPRKLSNTDKETAITILKESGIKDPSNALSTVVASQTNKYMSEGFDQATAVQKTIDDLKRSGAIKNYQRNIDIPFFGKTKVPFSSSTEFDITKSNVPNAPKKPLSSF